MLKTNNIQPPKINNFSTSSLKEKKSVSEDIDYKKELQLILFQIDKYSQKPKKRILTKAFNYAKQAHNGQFRSSGLPFMVHCIETAKILVDMKLDPVTIASGLLHDIVEDTGISIADISNEFGKEIAYLVNGVTKISELRFKTQIEIQAEYFRKMIFSMSEDLRVILIKFADRLHNMRTLEYLPPKRAKRIARETLDVYAPLAHRLGIARLKWELEDLSFKTLNPDDYYAVEKKIKDRREEREAYIEQITQPVKKGLKKNNIKAQISGRAKSFYSIYRKMKERGKSFEEIYDLLAIRIITTKIDDCYFALGLVHTLFTPVHERFKDYIATPKLNRYQSLHTTVVDSGGSKVEIQLRTEEMHNVAEFGIAAHWKYKERRTTDDELDRYSSWLREIIDWHKDTVDPEDYIDILKTDLFISEIFVFTPKGDLLKLPISATPLDFAFSIHTDIGYHCIGAKVNSQIVPLDSELKNGDSVEIITSSKSKPSQDWLRFVKTSKAKSKIKFWFNKARNKEAIELGKKIFKKIVKKNNLKYSIGLLRRVTKKLGRKNIEQVYKEIGYGNITLDKVETLISPKSTTTKTLTKKPVLRKRIKKIKKDSQKGILVQGMDNLLVSFARCCHPVPGDSIVGFISRGRGIIIHRRSCENALTLSKIPGRSIEVSWDVSGDESYLVRIEVVSQYRKNFIRNIGDSLANVNSNLLDIDMSTHNSIIKAYLVLEVRNVSHISNIIRSFMSIKGVMSVRRKGGLKETSND
ncbi:MAG: bifunctional (p)ppGpp synthetase/guanosine-3',5'-bis(diphosphate) 3'-pyrophosphohydrolase [bacterium]